MTTTLTTPELKSFTLPKGVYYVGDPCYVLKEDDYKTLHSDGILQKTGLTELHGHKLFILGDGTGDGCYELKDIYDDDGEEPWTTTILVDSGCWGVIPVELILDDETTEDDLYKLGHVIDSSELEDDDDEPVKEFDVDVTYRQDFPAFALILGCYKLTIDEEDEDA